MVQLHIFIEVRRRRASWMVPALRQPIGVDAERLVRHGAGHHVLADNGDVEFPGFKLFDQLAVEERGWPLQQKYLGTCLGWYTVAEGTLNRVVHIWRYDSQADREARRNAMFQDPAWKEFMRLSEEAAHLLDMRNVFLAPTSFSPRH